MSLLLAVRLEKPICGGWTHCEKLSSVLLTQVEMPMPFQRFHQGGQERDQSLRANVVRSRPRQVQCLLHFWSVVGWPWAFDLSLAFSRMTQETNRIFASIARCCYKLIKNHPFQS